ncbi:hypothetical protein C8R43DRAFT_1140287 [Mycena crocata]|nr:hypothetical protein C8R43DRAFT_1140287 [Mycena crocata]
MQARSPEPARRPRIAPAVGDQPPRPRVPYIMHSFEEGLHTCQLDPSIDLRTRLVEEMGLCMPPQPFMGEEVHLQSKTHAEALAKEAHAYDSLQTWCMQMRTRHNMLASQSYEFWQSADAMERIDKRITDLTKTREQREAREAARHQAASPAYREAQFHKFCAQEIGHRKAAIAVGRVTDVDAEYTPGVGLQYDPGNMEPREYRLHEVRGPSSSYGLRYMDWYGRAAMPLVQKDGTVVGVLGGRPRGTHFNTEVVRATKILDEVVPQVRLSRDEERRGCTHSLTGGIGLVHSDEPVAAPAGKSVVLDALVFAWLFSEPAIRKVAGYATCLFKFWAVNVHAFFDRALDRYEEYYDGSKRPLETGAFSAATFQLGSNPIWPVLDYDLAWGWCALIAFGNYNPHKGGHIILWDLNLLVRFPPGATILIPRALVRYSFVGVAAHETRHCLIQFTPQPVFSFAANGGMSDVNWARFATREEHAERAAERDGALSMSLLTKVDDVDDAWLCSPPAGVHSVVDSYPAAM